MPNQYKREIEREKRNAWLNHEKVLWLRLAEQINDHRITQTMSNRWKDRKKMTSHVIAVQRKKACLRMCENKKSKINVRNQNKVFFLNAAHIDWLCFINTLILLSSISWSHFISHVFVSLFLLLFWVTEPMTWILFSCITKIASTYVHPAHMNINTNKRIRDDRNLGFLFSKRDPLTLIIRRNY